MSSRRIDFPQTDDDIYPSSVRITLNDIPMYEAVLRDHPHDARGVLSYWRGGVGAYGYLAHTAAEGEMLRALVANTTEGALRLRCTVPENATARGGLLVYGAECGRYPLGPTVIIDW
jgi:predicted transcriptional regulator